MVKIKLGLKDWLGLFISLFLLWLTLREYSFQELSSDIGKLSRPFLLLACLSVAFPTVISGLRFKLFFSKVVNPIPSFFISNFYNQVLPGNLGDAMKLYHLNRKYGINLKTLLAYWSAEKYLGALILCLMFILPLLLIDNLYVIIGALAFIILILLVGAYLYLGYKNKKARKILFRFMPFKRFRRKVYQINRTFYITIEELSVSKKIYPFFIYTILQYLGAILFIYFSIRATGLPQVFLSIDSLLLITTTAIVTNFIPASPSAAGVMHYGLYKSFFILAEYNHIEVSPELNNLFVLGAVMFHFILLFMDILLGFPFLISERKWLFGKSKLTYNEVV